VVNELRQESNGRWVPEGEAVRLPPGATSTSVRPIHPGPHRLLLTTTVGDARLEATDLFVAGPVPEEVSQLVGTVPHLATLAALTGGKVVSTASPDLSALAIKPEVVVRVGVSADRPIWNHPLVFLVLLAVFGLEWYVERKIGYT